jgi:hypothetical protein
LSFCRRADSSSLPPEKVDSLDDDVKPLELLRQNSGLTVRVNELLAQNKALPVRIAVDGFIQYREHIVLLDLGHRAMAPPVNEFPP